MIEPLHGVTRDTAGPGQPAGHPRATFGNTPRTSSYVASRGPSFGAAHGPSSGASPFSSHVAGPLPSRQAAPPAGPDVQDQRYAALAAWSASAETITMAAVEAGPGSAYPRKVWENPEPEVRRHAVPANRVALLLAVLAAAGILAVLVAGLS
ncbi:hypothetical protein Q0Z83_106480 [Actinoplanes sichuanensis]|uniref:Serine protease n=1 Tax=Actinoplanes sichuanensis TaxID=512349 RepID=A0ABW4AMJ9_9ACTN|nr:hypothetical protein [Actinoplanes sichuanensis]BEL12457.1 hypothetical protein Q0Z83_106480 [Actinoplanes sichuanensis]